MEARRPEDEDAQVEDLDVPESESEDVKGGRWFMKVEGTGPSSPPPPPPKP